MYVETYIFDQFSSLVFTHYLPLQDFLAAGHPVLPGGVDLPDRGPGPVLHQ